MKTFLKGQQMAQKEPAYRILTSDGFEYRPAGEDAIRQWYREQRIGKTDRSLSCSDEKWEQAGDFFDVTTWDKGTILQSFLDGRVLILVGDITRQRVDVIVQCGQLLSAWRRRCGRRHSRSGRPERFAECRELRRTLRPGTPTGEAAITSTVISCAYVCVPFAYLGRPR